MSSARLAMRMLKTLRFLDDASVAVALVSEIIDSAALESVA
jgi:hypothetical protein